MPFSFSTKGAALLGAFVALGTLVMHQRQDTPSPTATLQLSQSLCSPAPIGKPNGVLELGEQCDDGLLCFKGTQPSQFKCKTLNDCPKNPDGTPIYTACNTVQWSTATCGECGGQKCDEFCRIRAVCGNGSVDTQREQCDPGSICTEGPHVGRGCLSDFDCNTATGKLLAGSCFNDGNQQCTRDCKLRVQPSSSSSVVSSSAIAPQFCCYYSLNSSSSTGLGCKAIDPAECRRIGGTPVQDKNVCDLKQLSNRCYTTTVSCCIPNANLHECPSVSVPNHEVEDQVKVCKFLAGGNGVPYTDDQSGCTAAMLNNNCGLGFSFSSLTSSSQSSPISSSSSSASGDWTLRKEIISAIDVNGNPASSPYQGEVKVTYKIMITNNTNENYPNEKALIFEDHLPVNTLLHYLGGTFNPLEKGFSVKEEHTLGDGLRATMTVEESPEGGRYVLIKSRITDTILANGGAGVYSYSITIKRQTPCKTFNTAKIYYFKGLPLFDSVNHDVIDETSVPLETDCSCVPLFNDGTMSEFSPYKDRINIAFFYTGEGEYDDFVAWSKKSAEELRDVLSRYWAWGDDLSELVQFWRHEKVLEPFSTTDANCTDNCLHTLKCNNVQNAYHVNACDTVCRSEVTQFHNTREWYKEHPEQVYFVSKGSNEELAAVSMKDKNKNLFVHEMGHFIWGLGDEYTDESKINYPKKPNCAPSLAIGRVWWDSLEWWKFGYEGCSYTQTNFRPVESTVMGGRKAMTTRTITDGYGPVGNSQVWQILSTYGSDLRSSAQSNNNFWVFLKSLMAQIFPGSDPVYTPDTDEWALIFTLAKNEIGNWEIRNKEAGIVRMGVKPTFAYEGLAISVNIRGRQFSQTVTDHSVRITENFESDDEQLVEYAKSPLSEVMVAVGLGDGVIEGEEIVFPDGSRHPYSVMLYRCTDNDEDLTNDCPPPMYRGKVVEVPVPKKDVCSDPDLLGCYQMEEGTGVQVKDSSATQNHGSFLVQTERSNWSDIVPTLKEVNTKSLYLGGKTDRLNIPKLTSTNLSQGSIAFWVNAATATNTGCLFCHVTPENTDRIYLSLYNNALHTMVGGREPGLQSTKFTLKPNTWTHIALVWKDGVYAPYINGKMIFTSKYSELSKPGLINVGAFPNNNTGNTDAAFDDIRLYKRALKQCEVLQLASGSSDFSSCL